MGLVNSRWMRNASIMSSAVTLKAALIYGGYRFGTYLDNCYGSAPYLMVLLITAGFGAGLSFVVWVSNRVNRDS